MTGEQIDAAEAPSGSPMKPPTLKLPWCARALAGLAARRPTAVGAQARRAREPVDGRARALSQRRGPTNRVDSGDAAIGRENFKAITAGRPSSGAEALTVGCLQRTAHSSRVEL